MTQLQRAPFGGLKVAEASTTSSRRRCCPAPASRPRAFWAGFDGLVRGFAPRNRELLRRRDALQAAIDDWHRERRGAPPIRAAYRRSCARSATSCRKAPDFAIDTANVDPEIARIAGPQLVVPVTNARYALNAANARWGSLYDALYGTDVIPREGGAAPAGATIRRAAPR